MKKNQTCPQKNAKQKNLPSRHWNSVVYSAAIGSTSTFPFLLLSFNAFPPFAEIPRARCETIYPVAGSGHERPIVTSGTIPRTWAGPLGEARHMPIKRRAGGSRDPGGVIVVGSLDHRGRLPLSDRS
jgi:hypothetical protein